MTLLIIEIVIYIILGLMAIDAILLLLIGLYRMIRWVRKSLRTKLYLSPDDTQQLPLQGYIDHKIARGQVYAHGYHHN